MVQKVNPMKEKHAQRNAVPQEEKTLPILA